MSVTAVRGPVTFSPTYLVLELRRALRNRRTMIFLLIMPPVFFLLFGHGYKDSEPAAFAYVMVSMAVYGAMIATTSIGAQVSVERSQGWTRQLRLTSLRPTGYVLTKVGAALILGVVPILIVLGVGASMGAQLSAGEWISVAVLSWFCSLVFAAFGLFIGYLIPAENAMQFMGPVLALMSFFGGLFQPLDQMPQALQDIAPWMPTYAVGLVARSPITDSGLTVAHVADLLLWTAVFVAGTAVLFRRDTKRV
ncbi:ABC-2 type transport system permease protein [Kineosporia succinea]|uniref:Transport permease protein n=1 Tax=Kineosporia succinea TaxID=84632 RepID=A0ABT9P6A2_9ACTN|nr:ABC transporter permease [Kineosporia succinea]MDP9828002.1 ABC-2 type transport system permease protein [Kineosporia succinea]